MIFLDNCAQSVAAGGSSSIVLGAALSGRRALGAAQDGQTGTFFVKDGSAWEVVRGTYTHATTTLALELIDSSTGSLLTVGTSAEVSLVWSSQSANACDTLAAAQFFGDGSDGDATVTTQIALTRDMYYRNLTLGAGGQLVVGDTNGPARIFVSGTLDLTAAAVGAIFANGRTGGNGVSSAANATSGGAGGSAASAPTGSQRTIGSGTAGAAGGSGGNSSGGNPGGNAAAATNAAGGVGGSGGEGAHGWNSVGDGLIGGTAGAITNLRPIRHLSHDHFVSGNTFINGGTGGGGGGAGRAGGYSGAGGGGGGAGGNILMIFARRIVTGASTPAATIQCRGGNGGNGGNAADALYAAGGGGGGGGGYVVLVIGEKAGDTIADLVDANGGTGGSKGTPGTYSNDGLGGNAGRITLVRLDVGINALYEQSTSPSGKTGGICKAAL